MSELLTIGPNGGDTYYTGPLTPAMTLAEAERFILQTRTEDGRFHIEFLDAPEDKVGAEWGTGETFEEAMRYALGAMFGPVDEEYDEAYLQRSLDARVWQTID